MDSGPHPLCVLCGLCGYSTIGSRGSIPNRSAAEVRAGSGRRRFPMPPDTDDYPAVA
jgi:hypothetical protein